MDGRSWHHEHRCRERYETAPDDMPREITSASVLMQPQGRILRHARRLEKVGTYSQPNLVALGRGVGRGLREALSGCNKCLIVRSRFGRRNGAAARDERANRDGNESVQG